MYDICVKNIPEKLTKEKLSFIFERESVKFHKIEKVIRNDSGHLMLVFISYKSIKDAYLTIDKMNNFNIFNKHLNVSLSHQTMDRVKEENWTENEYVEVVKDFSNVNLHANLQKSTFFNDKNNNNSNNNNIDKTSSSSGGNAYSEYLADQSQSFYFKLYIKNKFDIYTVDLDQLRTHCVASLIKEYLTVEDNSSSLLESSDVNIGQLILVSFDHEYHRAIVRQKIDCSSIRVELTDAFGELECKMTDIKLINYETELGIGLDNFPPLCHMIKPNFGNSNIDCETNQKLLVQFITHNYPLLQSKFTLKLCEKTLTCGIFDINGNDLIERSTSQNNFRGFLVNVCNTKKVYLKVQSPEEFQKYCLLQKSVQSSLSHLQPLTYDQRKCLKLHSVILLPFDNCPTLYHRAIVFALIEGINGLILKAKFIDLDAFSPFIVIPRCPRHAVSSRLRPLVFLAPPFLLHNEQAEIKTESYALFIPKRQRSPNSNKTLLTVLKKNGTVCVNAKEHIFWVRKVKNPSNEFMVDIVNVDVVSIIDGHDAP